MSHRAENPGRRPPAKFDWKRFWIRSAIAVLLFNGLAVLAARFWILPMLHPEWFPPN